MLWPVENVPMLSNNTEKLLFQSINCMSQFYSRYNHMRQWRTVNTTLEWPQLVSPPLQSSGSETLFVLRFHCRKTKTMTSLLVQSQRCGLVNYEKRGKGLSTLHCATWWRNTYIYRIRAVHLRLWHRLPESGHRVSRRSERRNCLKSLRK